MKLKKPATLIILALALFALIAKFCLHDSASEMKMPYVALNMVLRTNVKITDNEDYLKALERQSGMSRGKIKDLFKYLLKCETRDKVLINANSELSKSLKEIQSLPSDKQADFFAINILAPYLTMIVNNLAVNDSDESKIHAIFAKLFNAPKNKMNPLAELAEGTYRYNDGGTSNLSYKYELNNYLKNKGFYLDYDLGRTYANIFKIERVICADKDWKHGEKISIFVLKQIYPNILKAHLGYAPAWHSDVVVVKDFFYYIAEDYKNELKEKMPRIPYRDYGYQSLWKSLNLDIDLERANRIRYELAYKDLSGHSLAEIEKNLIAHTAIHEAKHRIDEIEMPSMRLNLDLEISARLTEAIFGAYPFLGLRTIIEWTEAYYRSTKYSQLKFLLADLWFLADKSLKENYTESFLRTEMIKIYENYYTIQEGERLINLEEFGRRMAPVIYLIGERVDMKRHGIQ